MNKLKQIRILVYYYKFTHSRPRANIVLDNDGGIGCAGGGGGGIGFAVAYVTGNFVYLLLLLLFTPHSHILTQSYVSMCIFTSSIWLHVWANVSSYKLYQRLHCGRRKHVWHTHTHTVPGLVSTAVSLIVCVLITGVERRGRASVFAFINGLAPYETWLIRRICELAKFKRIIPFIINAMSNNGTCLCVCLSAAEEKNIYSFRN